MRIGIIVTAATCASVIAACGGQAESAGTDETTAATQSSAVSVVPPSSEGAVFTMSDDGIANAVLAFQRRSDGSLELTGTIATEGVGSGMGEATLGSQGSVTLSRDGRHLFVVNAGSNDVTSFNVDGSTVTFASRESSGGTLPVSVDEHGGIVYVVNAGGGGNIFGFTVDPNGVLHPLAGSSRPLSATAAGPAEIAFDRTGEILTVTEKATQTISLYRVERGGYASLPSATPSAGKTPFGFVYTPEDVLVVTEAEGGSADGSTVSSYLLERRGLELASASVPDMQTAACWVAATADGRFAYVANAASGDISLYRINRRGALELANPAAAAIAMGKPLDTSLSDGDRFLYALDASHHVIQAFRVSDDGSLGALGPQSVSLPMSAVGLAAR